MGVRCPWSVVRGPWFDYASLRLSASRIVVRLAERGAQGGLKALPVAACCANGYHKPSSTPSSSSLPPSQCASMISTSQSKTVLPLCCLARSKSIAIYLDWLDRTAQVVVSSCFWVSSYPSRFCDSAELIHTSAKPSSGSESSAENIVERIEIPSPLSTGNQAFADMVRRNPAGRRTNCRRSGILSSAFSSTTVSIFHSGITPPAVHDRRAVRCHADTDGGRRTGVDCMRPPKTVVKPVSPGAKFGEGTGRPRISPRPAALRAFVPSCEP